MSDPRLGWHPDFHAAALARLDAAGTLRAMNPQALAQALADAPSAMSLAEHSLRALNQGQIGSCWVHGPVQCVETTGQALGLKVFPICRHLVGFVGKELEGGGNAGNGGSGYDAFTAMTTSGGGVGIAHEDLLPYRDSNRDIGTKPPAAVYEDAKGHWLDTIVKVQSLDEVKAWLVKRHAVAIGIWWPSGWGPSSWLKTSVGRGSYGHELAIFGYAEPGLIHAERCWRIENSWDSVYEPVPADIVAKVPGEKNRTASANSGFWTDESSLRSVLSMAGAELSTMTSLEKFGGDLTITDALAEF